MTQLIIVPVCLIGAFVVATIAVRVGIPSLKRRQATPSGVPPQPPVALPESSFPPRVFDWASTGFWIGLCETLIVFVFVFEREYGALALVVAAKEFARKEDIQKDPAYYLLGTLINLTTAMLGALLARTLAT
ncbi:MAG: hypothetical protein FJ279_07705 [Planctomycetes bacterium]|nr:hypothetical protein [Planctomycetota bacterium]MBM4079892.1 hypothetical protein [Planctomycetota bacterium]